jgi:hypothetical protein
MTTQLAGFTTANIMEVEANTKAARSVLRPDDYGSLGIYRVGGPSGVVAAAAVTTTMFSFRYGGANLCLVKRVLFSAGSILAFAAGVGVFQMFAARSFSASDTGGTSLLPSGNQNKMRTSMATTGMTDIRIATTATLTAGTRTLDTNAVGTIVVGIPAVAGTIVVPAGTPLLDQRPCEHPLVLANNEGFVISAVVPITGTWTFGVQVDYLELAAY